MAKTTTTNPLSSKLYEVYLIRDIQDGFIENVGDPLTVGLRLFDRNSNVYCQFEKIEMIESVFEPYPKGTLIVRDISDIASYIKNNDLDTIVMFDVNDNRWVFSITSVSYLNNAASDTEQNFVAINFTNYLYKMAEQSSLIQIAEKKPYTDLIHSFFKTIKDNYKMGMDPSGNPRLPADLSTKNHYLWHYFIDRTNNFVLYTGLQTLDNRTNIPIDNTIQYLNYLSSYCVPSDLSSDSVVEWDYGDYWSMPFQSGSEPPVDLDTFTYDSECPRFMFWTGWNNIINLKYFFQSIENDLVFQKAKKTLNLNYAVYDGDGESITMPIGTENVTFKKIYSLTTNPADQFMSKKYFYVRKTPKFLNNKGGTGLDGNTFGRLAFQFQDEGQKYDYELVSSEDIVNNIHPGANEMVDKNFWGFYDSMNPLDNTTRATHISDDFGYQVNYSKSLFMGLTGLMPYVDSAVMWKNQFDLTPLHPSLNDFVEMAPEEMSLLDKVLQIRYSMFEQTMGNTASQLEKIRQIERQNFVSYVLCCLKEQKEESFFAAILGYQAENKPYNQRGVNGEALKYRYYWAKLKLINDPYAIPEISPKGYYEGEGTVFRGFENQLWELDIGDPPYIFVNDPVNRVPGILQNFVSYTVPNGEWSGITSFQGYEQHGNTVGLMAINISERTNWYSLLGITYNTDYKVKTSKQYGMAYYGTGMCGASGGYYSPGWHAQSVKDENFTEIKYRALSQDIKDYVERVDPKGITYPSLFQDVRGMTSFIKRHIVRMHKTPIIKLLKESGITDPKTLFVWDGKFIYWFDSPNILDGPCN